MSAILPISDSKAAELRRIAAGHGIENVRVFGSFARGEASPESGLDLLVRLKPGHGFSDFMHFCDEVVGRQVASSSAT